MSTSVDTTLTRIRQEADIETTDQANSVCPDAMLLAWLNDAYRELYELISNETGQERFGISTTLTPPTFALPSDFFRLLGIDEAPLGTTLTGRPFQFAERNRFRFFNQANFRIDHGALIWAPPDQAPTSSVTLWYVPLPATLAGGGSFDAINGWDTFLILWVKLKVYAKQRYELGDVAAELEAQRRRIRNQAARIGAYPDVIEDVTARSDIYYYNG